MFRHLLVPTDGSQLSRDTAARAVAFARETGARITFFCAEKAFPTMYVGTGAIFDAQAPAHFHAAEDAVAHDILRACEELAMQAGVECSTRALASDEPYEAIIAAAEEAGCDLIFMASHGRRGIKALLLGSETQKVLTHSSIPVLVYR
ncbi:MAG: universal stress protein [Thauera sp.]|nr:universal stress protein [Thauera sp.]